MNSLIHSRLVCLCCGLFALPAHLAAAELSVSAPARLLGPPAESSAQPNNMVPRPEPPEIPTLVRGLLPQYRTTGAFRADAVATPDPDHSTRRFLLVMPDRMLLLQTTVTINGEPFEMIREQRIGRLLVELDKPEQDAGASSSTADAAEDSAADQVPAAESASVSIPESAKATVPDNTNGSEDATEEDAAEEIVTEGEAASESVVELIPVPSTTLTARLRRYARVTGRRPTRNEARWLLTKWIDGPTLLLLDENFQRFRGAQAPVLYVLDRDMDGNVSPGELNAAAETLLACDINQNDVVEYTEIAEVAADPRRRGRVAAAHVLIPLAEPATAAKSLRRFADRDNKYAIPRQYDADSNGALDSTEIARLSEIEPDVSIVVSFDTADAAKSQVTITQISTRLSSDPESLRKVGPAITVPIGGKLLEFSAVQSTVISDTDQISMGLVNDGYPLLPAIDPNEDGRLTIRELRTVVDALKHFDVDADGGISPGELPATVRVSIGLGPTVHQHLADMRSVHPRSETPRVEAPQWFTQMDRNKDGDISPREFLLGEDRFRELDADSDGLIGPKEALAAAPEADE